MDYRLYIDDIVTAVNRLGICPCYVADEEKNILFIDCPDMGAVEKYGVKVSMNYPGCMGYLDVKVFKSKLRIRWETGYREICAGGEYGVNDIAETLVRATVAIATYGYEVTGGSVFRDI